MILGSKNSWCQNLDSQDSQPERVGKFPEIDEYLAGNVCGFPEPSVGLRPGARCDVKDMSRSWPYGSRSLSAHSPLHSKSETQAFLYLREKVIAFNLTGWAWPLTHHHAALWSEASAVVLWWGGEGGAWAINMAQFKCQVLQFTSDLRFMGNAVGKSFSPVSLVL